MKPPRSILDKSFAYTNSAQTDVGKYLRQWKRQERDRKVAQARADAEAAEKVAPILTRRAST